MDVSAAGIYHCNLWGGRDTGCHELTQALKKPVDLVTTEALSHDANAARTEGFRVRMKEDEKLIYEEEH